MPAVATMVITIAPTMMTPQCMRQAQQRLDQHAGADHLRDQVADRDDQRADGGGQLDAARVVLGVDGVGEGVLAQPLHRLGHHEQRHDPAGQVADRVEEAVVARRWRSCRRCRGTRRPRGSRRRRRCRSRPSGSCRRRRSSRWRSWSSCPGRTTGRGRRRRRRGRRRWPWLRPGGAGSVPSLVDASSRASSASFRRHIAS